MPSPTPVSLPNRRSPTADVIAPDGSEIRMLIDERNLARGASMVEVLLSDGQVSRPVFHQTVEEIWYILSGAGHVWRCPPEEPFPDKIPAITVAAGDALAIPTGWSFQFSADTDGELRFLCVTFPPWPGPDEAHPARFGGLGAPTV